MRLRPRALPVTVDPGRDGLAAFASRHAPGWSMPRHAEPWHKLILALSGGVRLVRAGVASDLVEDLLVLVPAGSEHQLIDPPDREVVVVGVCAEALRLAAACGPAWPALAARLQSGIGLDRAAREALLRLVGSLISRPRRVKADGRLADWGRFLGLLAQLARRPVRPDPPGSADVAAVLTWLDEHAAQPVHVGGLALRAGLSYRAFTGKVRRLTGESVHGRILRLRLDRAATMLRSGLPPSEAALASGFGDLSGFYRHFRRRFGMTPGALRHSG